MGLHQARHLACLQLASAVAGLVWVDELLVASLLVDGGILLWQAAAALPVALVLRTVPDAVAKVDQEPCKVMGEKGKQTRTCINTDTTTQVSVETFRSCQQHVCEDSHLSRSWYPKELQYFEGN